MHDVWLLLLHRTAVATTAGPHVCVHGRCENLVQVSQQCTPLISLVWVNSCMTAANVIYTGRHLRSQGYLCLHSQACPSSDSLGDCNLLTMPEKVMLVGPVRGSFEAFRKRIDAVNKKAGPFAGCLCVGQFFAEGDADEDTPSAVTECIDATRPFTVPVFFIGAVGETRLRVPCGHKLGRRFQSLCLPAYEHSA